MEDNRTVEEYLSKTAAILDELESKVRRVRTPEGAARYGQPINSIIKPDVVPNVPIKVPHQIGSQPGTAHERRKRIAKLEEDAKPDITKPIGSDLPDDVKESMGWMRDAIDGDTQWVVFADGAEVGDDEGSFDGIMRDGASGIITVEPTARGKWETTWFDKNGDVSYSEIHSDLGSAMARADELKPKEKQSPKIGPDWSGSMKKLLEADEGWEYDERVLMGRKIPVLKKGDYIIGKHVAGGFVVRYGSTNRYNITQTLKQAVAIADNDGLKNPRPYQRRPKAPEPRRRRAKKPSGGTPELRGSTLQYNGTKVKIKTNPDGTPYAPSSIQTLMTSLRRAIGHAAWLDELNRGSEGFTSDKEVAAAQKRLSDIVKMSEWFIDKHGSPADRRALRQIQSNGPAPRRRMTY